MSPKTSAEQAGTVGRFFFTTMIALSTLRHYGLDI
jgi:hypothetical protein